MAKTTPVTSTNRPPATKVSDTGRRPVERPRKTMSPPAAVCLAMGAIFIMIAIWGFVDGENVLIFTVSTAHNWVHLLSGAAALACGFAGPAVARGFCWAFALVYGLVALLGFAGVPFVVELLHINPADNWLHVGITLVFLLGAVAGLRRPVNRRAVAPRTARLEREPDERGAEPSRA